MSAAFEIGSLVRYKEGGPRVTIVGFVGEVAKPTDEGARLGWVRANCDISYDDYAPDELELAKFWVLKGHSNKWSLGPFISWNDASNALCGHILENFDFGDLHPLNLKRDQFLQEISECLPTKGGRLFVSELGNWVSYVIRPAGDTTPILYDEKGRAYA